MNGVSFSLKKYMNGSCFSLSLVYEWGGVRGLQQHIRTQNHGKLPPPREKQNKLARLSGSYKYRSIAWRYHQNQNTCIFPLQLPSERRLSSWDIFSNQTCPRSSTPYLTCVKTSNPVIASS